MLLLTKEELRRKIMLYSWKIFLKTFANDRNYQKVRGFCNYTGKYRGAAHSICNLTFNVLNEFFVVFHGGSNYDYHNIIKELGNEFEGQFEYLERNIEKLKMKNCSTILTEKQQSYQHYCQVMLINMNVLQVKKYYNMIK